MFKLGLQNLIDRVDEFYKLAAGSLKYLREHYKKVAEELLLKLNDFPENVKTYMFKRSQKLFELSNAINKKMILQEKGVDDSSEEMKDIDFKIKRLSDEQNLLYSAYRRYEKNKEVSNIFEAEEKETDSRKIFLKRLEAQLYQNEASRDYGLSPANDLIINYIEKVEEAIKYNKSISEQEMIRIWLHIDNVMNLHKKSKEQIDKEEAAKERDIKQKWIENNHLLGAFPKLRNQLSNQRSVINRSFENKSRKQMRLYPEDKDKILILEENKENELIALDRLVAIRDKIKSLIDNKIIPSIGPIAEEHKHIVEDFLIKNKSILEQYNANEVVITLNKMLDIIRQRLNESSENKKVAYYQGTEELAPHKKKYKSDRAIVVQPRFKEPFFKNFDYAESEGVDGPAKHGPGTGLFRNMEKYKNVKDFLKKKRERNKDKYKADDSYIEDDGSLTKNKIAKRINYLRNLIKTAEDNNSIDFPIDEQIKSDPILGDSGTYSNSAQLGGLLDPYTQQQDVDGNQPMNIGPYEREHTEDATDLSLEQINELEQIDELKEILKSLKNKSLTPKDTELYGLPQGSNLWEESDILSDNPNYYGTTDSGNTLYDKK